MQGPFPRLRLRADSHIPATQCCAARNPPPIISQRRLGAPAARQLGATPPKVSAARPHCGRAPTYAPGPLGGRPPLMTPLSRGGADPESRVAADVHQQKPCLAPPPTGPGNERRLRLERNLRPLATSCPRISHLETPVRSSTQRVFDCDRPDVGVRLPFRHNCRHIRFAKRSEVHKRLPKRQWYGRPMEKCEPPSNQRHIIRLDLYLAHQ